MTETLQNNSASSFRNPGGPICGRCKQIPLKSMTVTPQDRSMFELGTMSHIVRDTSCRCCIILSRLLTNEGRSDPATSEATVAISAFQVPQMYSISKDLPDFCTKDRALGMLLVHKGNIIHGRRSFVNIGNSGFISPVVKHNSERTFGARHIPAAVDLNLIKQWLDYCCKNHGSNCHSGRKLHMKNMKAIDCETRQLGPIHVDAPFVALSYVWGNLAAEQSVNTATGLLPKDLPGTIEDAITVTKELGFQYLWVDRYCIPQNDCAERHAQIQQMDRVYSNAGVTIIAAAGEDPTFGLPGVGHRLRQEQPSMTIEGVDYVLVPPHPRKALQSSTWNSRAWTYQETVFSERRLVFFDQQVYFECQGMQCLESMQFPLDEMHDPSLREFDRLWQKPLFHSVKISSNPLAKFSIHLARYTARHLSFPEDILNAFSGILAAYERTHLGVLHIQGLPLVACLMPADDTGAVEGSTRLDQFITALGWKSARPATRRNGFPSWSWAGWKGPAVGIETHIHSTFDIQFQLEIEGGNLMSVEMLCASKQIVEKSRQNAVQLVAHAAVLPVRLQSTRRPFPGSNSRWHAILRLHDRDVVCHQFNLSYDIESGAEGEARVDGPSNWKIPCFGLLLGKRMLFSGTAFEQDQFVVLVVQKQGALFERVGIIELDAKGAVPEALALSQDPQVRRTIRLC